MNELSRRTFVKGVAATAPLALVLSDPRLAAAVAAGLETVTIATADGRKVTGALAMPAKTPAPTVLLIHEWWGLNDQIKSVAAEFAKLGYIALALDLYDGKLAKDGDRETASSYRKAVKAAEATATVAAWVQWLKKHGKGTGKVGTVGWCFGGGWSLNASIAAPVDATVVYYGAVTRKADDLKKLKGPVLGHFGTKDKNINKPMVDGFEAEMKKAGKPFTTHWYEADHAFANPTGNRYHEANAKLSWQRTQDFFAKHLKG